MIFRAASWPSFASGTIALAAEASGAGVRTVFTWLERGRRGGTRNARHVTFLHAVERAQGEAEAMLVARIAKQAATSWRAAAWLLEHRWPERWAPRERGGDIATPDVEPDALDVLDELAPRRRARPSSTSPSA